MSEASAGQPPPSSRGRGRGRRRFRGRPRGSGPANGITRSDVPNEPIASSSSAPPAPAVEQPRDAPPPGEAEKPTRGRHRFPKGRGARTVESRPPAPPPPADSEPLAVRLAYELTHGTYECLICVANVTRSQSIWSCDKCFAVMHLGCVADWATRSVSDAKERAAMLANRDGQSSMTARQANAEIHWRCPACRTAHDADHVPNEYRCYCGRLREPHPPPTSVPHSCASTCRRARPEGCEHGCKNNCHPGPCEPCSAVLSPTCHCGKTTLAVRCSQLNPVDERAAPAARLELLSCKNECGKRLTCGAHACSAPCHPGPCPPCEVIREKTCFCGQETKEERCSEADKRETCFAQAGEVTWTGEFSCGRVCKWTYSCGKHRCEKPCHPHTSAEPLLCPRDPSLVRFCPCGSARLSTERQSCSDPIPTCGRLCGKILDCGHSCQSLCHEGACPACVEPITVVCRCGNDKKTVSCAQAARDAVDGERLCDRPCRAMRYCGRHVCHRKCCPLAYQEAAAARKGKGKKALPLSALDFEQDDPLGLHNCDIVCGKLLDCKRHHCERPDHRGPCGRCLNASFEELRCPCGLTVLEPPVACGAEVRCSFPCTRPPPACGHPKTPHTCHPDDEPCPPCPFLVTKNCSCPRHQPVRNVKCSAASISCGLPCGRQLSCGWHTCRKTCHTGECESPCAQTCGKPRKLCGHPCTLQCHAPSSCSLDTPCGALVEASCACGHIKQRVVCGSCNERPESNSTRQLKCNDTCALTKRNAALADALGIDTAARVASNAVEWPAELLQLYAINPTWSKSIEETLTKLIEDAQKVGGKGSHLFPPMRWQQRQFVHELAERYGLESESLDAEPNRSVFARFKPLSSIPSPLISAAYAEQVKSKSIVVPAARKPTKQAANALLLHGLKSDGPQVQSRIISHLSALHDAALSPTEIDGAVLLILTPPPASVASLDKLRGALAFDAVLGCTSVELVYIEPSTHAIQWREKGGHRSLDSTPAPSRPMTPVPTKPNAFAALDKAWTTLPKPARPAAEAATAPAVPVVEAGPPPPESWDEEDA